MSVAIVFLIISFAFVVFFVGSAYAYGLFIKADAAPKKEYVEKAELEKFETKYYSWLTDYRKKTDDRIDRIRERVFGRKEL